MDCVIIDNYISKELLDVLSKTNKDVIIYTKNIDNNIINKYQSQYHNVTIKLNNSFHDRFIIIDNILYHVGASFKDLGKKCFAINKIEDKEYEIECVNTGGGLYFEILEGNLPEGITFDDAAGTFSGSSNVEFNENLVIQIDNGVNFITINVGLKCV